MLDIAFGIGCDWLFLYWKCIFLSGMNLGNQYLVDLVNTSQQEMSES